MGAARTIAYAEAGTDLGLDAGGGTYQTASNAVWWLDGTIRIEGTSNRFDNAIAGVSIVLTEEGMVAPATLTIATDATALPAKINTFIDAFNWAAAAGHSAAGFGIITASNPYVAADSSIRSAIDQLALMVSGPVPGAPPRARREPRLRSASISPFAAAAPDPIPSWRRCPA